jgi:hypothetical protein
MSVIEVRAVPFFVSRYNTNQTAISFRLSADMVKSMNLFSTVNLSPGVLLAF